MANVKIASDGAEANSAAGEPSATASEEDQGKDGINSP